MNRQINRIILHCSATPRGRDIGYRTIYKWHTDPRALGDGKFRYMGETFDTVSELPHDVRNRRGNGWLDIGYHYVIRLDGTIEEGRPIERAGAHVLGHNHDSIGICYVGGVSADDIKIARDTRTPDQIDAMDKLIAKLKKEYGDRITVHGHNEYDNKACPSFDVHKDNIRRKNRYKDSTTTTTVTTKPMTTTTTTTEPPLDTSPPKPDRSFVGFLKSLFSRLF